MFAGILPDENTGGAYSATDWWQFCQVTHKETPIKAITAYAPNLFGPFGGSMHYTSKVPAITFLDVYAHGVQLV